MRFLAQMVENDLLRSPVKSTIRPKLGRSPRVCWPYQQLFLDWLAENRGNFFYPRTLPVVTPGYIAFGLQGLSPLLRVKVFDQQISVEVQHCGHRLCSLAEFTMQAVVGPEGSFYCASCDQEGEPRLYPTLESMRREHLYAPLLRWIAEVLPAGKWIEIVQFRGGGTTARLFPYTYSTPSLHFDDFMDQLEMKYELCNTTDYRQENIAGFFYAPLFGEPSKLQRFMTLGAKASERDVA
jgi:hypothetical protein